MPVGSVVVEIGARTQGLTRGLNRAQTKLQAFGERVSGVTGTLSSFGGVAAGVATGALATFTAQAVASVAALERQARALGVSAETFQELSFAARQFNSDSQDIAEALATIADRATDAVAGTASMVDDFALIGISVDELRGKNPVQLFRLFADAIAATEDPSDRVTAAVRTLGDDLGLKLLPLLRQGSKGLDRYAKSAHELGVVLNDDLTAEALETEKAFKKLTETLEKQWQRSVLQTIQDVKDLGAAISGLFEDITTNSTAERIETLVLEIEQLERAEARLAKVNAVTPELLEKIADKYRLLAKLRAELNAKPLDIVGGTPVEPTPTPDEDEDGTALPPLATEAMKDRLEVIRQQLATERELEMEHFALQREVLVESLASKQITIDEFRALAEKAESQHMKRLTEIRKSGMSDLEKFTAQSYAKQAQTIFGELTNITAGVAQHNKTLFQLNKAAGIAEAIINAYIGISKTMSAYPYPINIAMAAAHAAAAFAQVNAIRSASFQGGGGGSAPSIRGSTAAQPTTPVGGAAAAGDGNVNQVATINLIGNVFSREQIEELIPLINEAVADGARIRLA